MKKVIAILLAAMLTLGMAFTVFAADSPKPDENEKIILEETAKISDDDVIKGAQSLGIDMNNYTIKFKYDIYYVKNGERQSSYEGTYTHEGICDVGSETDVIVIHQHNGTWRKLASTITNGKVNATFNGFSYGAVLVKKATTPVKPDDGNKPAQQDTKKPSSSSSSSSSKTPAKQSGGKSPDTGEAPVAAGLALTAILAGAGAVIFGRRKSAE